MAMRLNDDQAAALGLIARTRKRAERAAEDAHRAILEAIEAGVPQTRVAETARISRMSMWRRLNDLNYGKDPDGHHDHHHADL